MDGMEHIASLFKSAYSGKTILLTGHTGFKGAWMTLWLSTLGANVIGFALPAKTQPNLFTKANIVENITHIEGDIRNLSTLKQVINTHKPDFIFHMAAQTLVGNSYIDPLDTFSTNITGTINLFESLRTLNHRATVINITTDKCYHNTHQKKGYIESKALGGHDPYSASKACSEIITSSYRHSFFKNTDYPIATARSGNIIGGGDWSDFRLLPDCARAIHSNEPFILRSPNSIRPWQHVLDALSGYLLLGARLSESPKKFSEAYNFAPSDQTQKTAKEIVSMMLKYWKPIPITLGNTLFFEHELLLLNPKKAKKQLKWKSLLEIKQAVSWTAKWYASFYNNPTEAKNLTLSQIQNYCKLAKEKKVVWAI